MSHQLPRFVNIFSQLDTLLLNISRQCWEKHLFGSLHIPQLLTIHEYSRDTGIVYTAVFLLCVCCYDNPLLAARMLRKCINLSLRLS